MATKVKNLGVIEKKLRKEIKAFKNDNKELQRAAKTIKNEMTVTLRSGRNIDGTDMPALDQKTVKRRARLLTKNKKHQKAQAGKSNLTLTGDFIRKLVAVVKGNKIILTGKGNHKPYKGLKVRTLKGSNAKITDIIAGLSKRGWKILGVTDKAKERVANQFRAFLRRRNK